MVFIDFADETRVWRSSGTEIVIARGVYILREVYICERGRYLKKKKNVVV